MQIFMSWSGGRSKEFAELLKAFLQSVIQATKPWVSDSNIDRGAVWFTEVYAALEKSDFGILCITASNKNKPWLLFEAGALAKGMTSARVCPVVIDTPKPSVGFPLAAMQMTSANDKDEMFKLIDTINATLGEKRVEQSVLVRTFDMWWPDFESKLKAIVEKPDGPPAPVTKRSVEELMGELLSLVQSQNQRLSAIEAQISNPTVTVPTTIRKLPHSDVPSDVDWVFYQTALRSMKDALSGTRQVETKNRPRGLLDTDPEPPPDKPKKPDKKD